MLHYDSLMFNLTDIIFRTNVDGSGGDVSLNKHNRLSGLGIICRPLDC